MELSKESLNQTESSNFIVCPFCQTGFRFSHAESRCPVCWNEFDYTDWPIKEACSPIGKMPRLSLLRKDNNTLFVFYSDFLIGREPGSRVLQLSSPRVSKKHARVFLDNGCWKIESLGNDVIIKRPEQKEDLTISDHQSVELASGDEIYISAFNLTVLIRYMTDCLPPFTRNLNSISRNETFDLDSNCKTETKKSTLKSIIKGIIEVLQLLAMVVLAFIKLIAVADHSLTQLSALGVEHKCALPASWDPIILCVVLVLGGALYWHSRREYWEW